MNAASRYPEKENENPTIQSLNYYHFPVFCKNAHHFVIHIPIFQFHWILIISLCSTMALELEKRYNTVKKKKKIIFK